MRVPLSKEEVAATVPRVNVHVPTAVKILKKRKKKMEKPLMEQIEK